VGVGFLQSPRLLDGSSHGELLPNAAKSRIADNGVEFELAEACLAHAAGNAVVHAYQRSSMLERRRPIMQAWPRSSTASRPTKWCRCWRRNRGTLMWSAIWPVLATLAVGGAGWFVASFVAKPFLDFLTLRSQVHEEILFTDNVGPISAHCTADHDRAADSLRRLGANMKAMDASVRIPLAQAW
jgi:hypothetical protein